MKKEKVFKKSSSLNTIQSVGYLKNQPSNKNEKPRTYPNDLPFKGMTKEEVLEDIYNS